MLVMEGGALSGLAGFVEQAWARAIAWQLSPSPCADPCAAGVQEPKPDKHLWSSAAQQAMQHTWQPQR